MMQGSKADELDYWLFNYGTVQRVQTYFLASGLMTDYQLTFLRIFLNSRGNLFHRLDYQPIRRRAAGRLGYGLLTTEPFGELKHA